MNFSTADLCDAHGDVDICEPMFVDFGGRASFAGPVSTVQCFEDNSRVKEALNEPGEGRVLVVDGGGSRNCALLGDMLGQKAVDNGWVGVILYGCVRDTAVLGTLELGVRALAAMPRRSDRRGEGHRDVGVRFGGAAFAPGHWVYVDPDGILVAKRRLD
ncbi:MAG TPA: ribonuclease E activity regulator RraA [Steroidobacteraceae bacterium]|nr:ribonuclease E activity regulator RraA [Steroidobacteraceae bacterium]